MIYRQIIGGCTGEPAMRRTQADRLWCFLQEVESVGFGCWIVKVRGQRRDAPNDAWDSNLTEWMMVMFTEGKHERRSMGRKMMSSVWVD